MINPLLLEKAKQKGTDAQYLAWVRTMPSAITGTYSEWVHGKGRCEAAHVRRASEAGVAFKPPYSAIPLTHDEHAMQHRKGESIFCPPEWYDKQAVRYLTMWINGAQAPEEVETEHWKREYTIEHPGQLVAFWLLAKKHFSNPAAKLIKLTMQPMNRKRSLKQNNAQWGLMYDTMLLYYKENPGDLACDVLQALKFDVSKQFIHEMCKMRFQTKTTARISTVESNEYAKKVKEWFFHKYKINIPEPNEVIYE